MHAKMRSLPIALVLLAAAPPDVSPPDILPPGHRPVRHEIVLQVGPELADWKFVATPVRGFSGVHSITPGEGFRFSSKYGTRIYAFPAAESTPTEFDKEWNARHPRSRTFQEITSAPWSVPLERVVTTYRVTAISSDQVSVEQTGEVRFAPGDTPFNPWGLGLVLIGIAAVGVGGLVWITRLRRTAIPRT